MAVLSYNPRKRSTRKTYDTESIEDLKAFAESKGFDVKKKKTSLFRRTLDIISRPLYTSAGAAKAIVKNLDKDQTNNENILEEAWKGLSGKEKETYSDVLGELGVENKYIKGGFGFVLDVALDPTTYFGGALIKGVGKAVKGTATVGMTGLSKAAPDTARYLTAAGNNLKDAFGTAFKFGYGTTKKLDKAGKVVGGVADDLMRGVNKLGIVKEEIGKKGIAFQKSLLKKYSKKEIAEADDIIFKNKSLELKARDGAKVSYLKSGSKNVEEILNVYKDKGKELAKLYGISEKKAYQWYVPSIAKDSVRKLSESTSVLKTGVLGGKKNFADKLDRELLEKPFEAYTRREWEVVRNGMVDDTLDDLVSSYGKKFETLEDAVKAGYKPIYKKDKLQFYPEVTQAGKDIAAVKKATPLGYLKEADAKFINDFMAPEFKALDVLAKTSGFDKMTRWFKTAVTAWFPAFHIRNMISGNVQNYSVLGKEALNPVNHVNGLGFLKGTKNVIKFKNWTGTGKEMQGVLNENFRGASRYISDLSSYIDETVDGGFKMNSAMSKLNPRQIGNFVEMWQKSTAVSAALRKGETLERAIKLAEKAGFDYTKITKFESSIMKRLIPFYSFARKNAELQLRTFAKNPERILNQAKFANALSNVFGSKVTEEDLSGIPKWALNGLGFKIEGGKYVSQLGLPLEEFMDRIERPMGTTLSSLNPIIKYPLESKLGYDFFRESQIVDIKNVAPTTGKKLMEAKEAGKLPEWFDKMINIKSYTGFDGKTRYTASPKALHILRNLPTSRFQNTLEKVLDKDEEGISKWLSFFSGMKIYDIEIEQQSYFQERDLRRDIQDQLLESGIGSKQENFYIYK